MNNQPAPVQASPKRAIIAVAAMLAVGALIIILDFKQIKLLAGMANLWLLPLALIFVAVSYACATTALTLMLGTFGIRAERPLLVRLNLVSIILDNLITQPAGISMRLLVLGRRGNDASPIVAASLFFAYLKNMVFLSLVPLGLVLVLLTHPLPGIGTATLVIISVVLVIGLSLFTAAVFNNHARAFLLRLTGRLWRTVTRRDISQPLDHFSDVVGEGIVELRSRPHLFQWVATLVIADVLSMIIALWFCALGLGVRLGFEALLTGFNFGVTLTIITFIPGDIGVQEATIGGILALFGVPFSEGLLVAILFRVVYYFIPFIATLGIYRRLFRG